jgi:hypothetical protein
MIPSSREVHIRFRDRAAAGSSSRLTVIARGRTARWVRFRGPFFNHFLTLFQSNSAPNPDGVAEAISELIAQPKGTRPARRGNRSTSATRAGAAHVIKALGLAPPREARLSGSGRPGYATTRLTERTSRIAHPRKNSEIRLQSMMRRSFDQLSKRFAFTTFSPPTMHVCELSSVCSVKALERKETGKARQRLRRDNRVG